MRLASLFVITSLLSSCVTIPNTTACSVAGRLDAGMLCAETGTPRTSSMDLAQTIYFLEPQPSPSPGMTPRAGAICQSAEDWNKVKTALEQACRELGSKCSFEVQSAPKTLYTPLVNTPD